MLKVTRIGGSILLLSAIIGGWIALSVFGGSNSASIHVPVLETCVDATLEAIEKIPNDIGYDASFIAFDYRLKSHPNVAGYLALNSRAIEYDRMIALANGLTSSCTSQLRNTYSKTDSSAMGDFVAFLEDVDRGLISYSLESESGLVDRRKIYIVNDNEELTVYFSLED